MSNTGQRGAALQSWGDAPSNRQPLPRVLPRWVSAVVVTEVLFGTLCQNAAGILCPKRTASCPSHQQCGVWLLCPWLQLGLCLQGAKNKGRVLPPRHKREREAPSSCFLQWWLLCFITLSQC